MELKNTVLGIELGSTRIKGVLLDDTHTPIATGSFDWENKLVDGVWTYDLDLIHTGIQACYADLARDVQEKFGMPLTTVGAIGISGMMHGYSTSTFPSAGAFPICIRPSSTRKNTCLAWTIWQPCAPTSTTVSPV